MTRILVGTIFSNVKDYIIRDWFKNVRKLSHAKFDFCAVDNSMDKKYHKKIFKYFSEHKNKSNIGKLTVLHTPQIDKRSEVFMAFSSNELRRYFLKNNYDALLYLECDVIPPINIIEILLSYNKPVISAMYFTGDKKNSYPIMGDLDYFIHESPQMVMKSYIEGFYDIGEWTDPKEVISAGLGCILVCREVINRIPFRYDDTFQVHNDTMFAKDLWDNGIQNLQVPIMCRHENVTWDIQKKLVNKNHKITSKN